MSVVWLVWGVVGGSVLVAFAAIVLTVWQLCRYRELKANAEEGKACLRQLRGQRDQLVKQVQELKAGLRAEKAHVAQLQRQLELLREL